MPTVDLIQAVAVTAELCGRTFSPAAAQVFVEDLSAYPEPLVLKALTRCRKEVRGLLTVNDVIERIDDGHPGPEEAWSIAMPARDEDASVVWTEQMARAFFQAALPLIDEGDKIGARRAFVERYAVEVQQARAVSEPARWIASLGHNPDLRRQAVANAVAMGRIGRDQAANLLPAPEPTPEAKRLLAHAIRETEPTEARKHLNGLRRILGNIE